MNILEEIPQSKNESSSFMSRNNDFQMPKMTSETKISNNSGSESKFASPAKFNTFVLFDVRTMIIIILLILIFLANYGINVFGFIGELIQKVVDVSKPHLSKILGFIGYSSGTAINKTAEVTSSVTKGGVDIAEGAIQNIGDILIGDEAIAKDSIKHYTEPSEDTTENPIQKSLSSSKAKWCLVGEYKNKRGCIDISESDKCMSGQVFPNEKMCMNPNITP